MHHSKRPRPLWKQFKCAMCSLQIRSIFPKHNTTFISWIAWTGSGLILTVALNSLFPSKLTLKSLSGAPSMEPLFPQWFRLIRHRHSIVSKERFVKTRKDLRLANFIKLIRAWSNVLIQMRGTNKLTEFIYNKGKTKKYCLFEFWLG